MNPAAVRPTRLILTQRIDEVIEIETPEGQRILLRLVELSGRPHRPKLAIEALPEVRIRRQRTSGPWRHQGVH